MTDRIVTLTNEDGTIGVTIDPDGTAYLATRDDITDMWSAPSRLNRTTDTLTDLARCELVEWAWSEIIPNGEIICAEDGSVTDPDGVIALDFWTIVTDHLAAFDVDAPDIRAAGDRAIAVRVAQAMDALWNGEQTNPNYRPFQMDAS